MVWLFFKGIMLDYFAYKSLNTHINQVPLRKVDFVKILKKTNSRTKNLVLEAYYFIPLKKFYKKQVTLINSCESWDSETQAFSQATTDRFGVTFSCFGDFRMQART
jgi:hypothetical protein